MADVQIVEVASFDCVPVLIERLLFNHPVLVLVVVECVLALPPVYGAGAAAVLRLRFGDVLGELEGAVSRGFLFLLEGGRGRDLCADTQQVLPLTEGFRVVLRRLKFSTRLLPVF